MAEAKAKKASADDDTISDAMDAFQLAEENESDNRLAALDDLKFAKLGEQWPESVRQQRIKDGRPCLTINRQPAFIRQVVNEARQNRPAIKVHPVDSNADVEVADIYNGLIRNIEQTSKADVAYDTAVDFAVSMGFGYFRIDTDYACDDSFELDILINRIANPFSVYGDPFSTGCDSADWNTAFITEVLSESAFEKKYKGAQKVNWADDYSQLKSPWYADKSVLVAEWWRREKVPLTILALSDGSVVAEDVYAEHKAELDAQGVIVLGTRKSQTHKVTQTVMTGAEVLERNDWAGKFIPIVPVYGDEVNVEGKRYFRSLIRDAKDPQRMLNYWRTASTELTALAPRVPFIGKKGAFKTDAKKWANVNSQNYSHIEYDGDTPPARQPLDSGRAIGAIQEALNAQDDMKSILGLYDATLGAEEGKEESGRAILARQKQGDTSNFHFIDNLARAIEHGGRILIDLIPTVYTGERMIRVLGYDNSAENVKLGSAIEIKGEDGQPQIDPASNMPMTKIIDLSRGKYDLTVEAGPSYGTKRQETAEQIINLIQAFPPAAPVLGDLLAKNLDWPEAEEVARRLHSLLPPELRGEGAPQDPMQSPQVQQMVQQGTQMIQQLQTQLQATTQQLEAAKQANEIKAAELKIKAFEAETDRLRARAEALTPETIPETTAH